MRWTRIYVQGFPSQHSCDSENEKQRKNKASKIEGTVMATPHTPMIDFYEASESNVLEEKFNKQMLMMNSH